LGFQSDVAQFGLVVMSNEVDNIVRQASQGSVAAIIQVLNEKLASLGVRTRAVFENGVLQLLCEAATIDQLEPSFLVERIRQILETIAPRSVRRVRINSRIVKEQQLLWLEEISRDPENQLLWSEEITLRQPNLFKRFLQNWQSGFLDNPRPQLQPFSQPKSRDQQIFWRGLLGGTGLGMLLLGGWLFYNHSLGSSGPLVQFSPPIANSISNSPASPSSGTGAAPAQPDPFVSAVRIAEQASQDGTHAHSLAQWLELAARWQKASDLMAAVPETDPRYKTAQDRTVAYQKNREIALESARKLQLAGPDTSPSTPPEPSASPAANP
jgi:hypothetical protein